MKQAIIFIIIFFFISGSMQAQRRLPGQKGIKITGGVVDGFGKRAFHTGVAFSRFTKNSNQWVFGAEYLRKNLVYDNRQLVPVEQFTGEGSLQWTLLSDRKKIFFCSGILSGMMGYELVNRDEPLLYDGSLILSGSKFLYGGALGLEVESYIVDGIILITGIRQRILFGSTINRAHFQLTFGIKIIIN